MAYRLFAWQLQKRLIFDWSSQYFERIKKFDLNSFRLLLGNFKAQSNVIDRFYIMEFEGLVKI